MQTDPIESTLKAHGTVRLTLKYDKLLSSFAFNFNLRRFIQEQVRDIYKNNWSSGADSAGKAGVEAVDTRSKTKAA